MKEQLLKVHEKIPHSSYIELGTVISADPLVISLDLEASVQLEFNVGDFVMNDMLILSTGDRVVVSRMLNPHLYCVMFRIRGTLGKAVIGSGAAALAVARLGDTVVVNTTSGVGTITTASGKVSVE